MQKRHGQALWDSAGGLDQLASHAEVVMLDFAASMLAELERWMLTAGPAMIDLNNFCDTSDKLMSSASVVEEVQKRLYTDEVRLCQRRSRLRSHYAAHPAQRCSCPQHGWRGLMVCHPRRR